MFNYAQINELGYCIGISCLSGEVIKDDLILIDDFDNSYINRKYDIENQQWTDEYYIAEQIKVVNEHEEITKEVYQTTSLSVDDNLINMDLLISIDDKLNLIMDHLGLNV